MSIASEITDLQTNLQAAKSAVTTKGGTVADTGLAGLASEIASIPSGGSITEFGSIKYLDSNNVEQTLVLENEDYFLELTVASGSSFPFKFGDLTIYSDKITEVTIADGVQYLPSAFMGFCNNLTKAILPSSIHFIGDGVFSFCDITNAINLENVRYIGGSFLSRNTHFNNPIYIPHIDRIGDSFLTGCTSFNSTLTLNTSMMKIGSYFLNNCSSFAQPLSLPILQPISSQVNPGPYFMPNCNSFVGPLVCNTPHGSSSDTNTLSTTTVTAPMYTTGVTLTGPYAQDWKDTYVDRTSSPYRKLTVGS